ncbi:MAG: GGDEF domain-containing protein [Gammaproteobacteria bacterium]
MPQSLCQKYGFDLKGRQTRLTLLDLNSEAQAILTKLHIKVILPSHEIMVDKFYDYLLAQEPMKEFLHGDCLIERLKKTQAEYISTIGVNYASEEYFETRLVIGMAHANIGLPLSLYQCSYTILQEIIVEQIQLCESLSDKEKIIIQKFMYRITTLDKSLAMESYFNLNIENLEHSIDVLKEKSATLKSEVDFDSLTRVHSRKKILNYLNNQLPQLNEKRISLAVVVADLDNFKKVNDHYGHRVGDDVLKHTAARIQGSIRDIDLVGRYGGEEFLILLPGVDNETAIIITERIRSSVAKAPITYNNRKINMTISLGLTMAKLDDDINSLFNRADNLMYDSKHKGRNCISWDMK